MQYKTICLQKIQSCPEMYDNLLKNRNLLPTLERYASLLRTSHLDWKEQLSQARPGSNESQITSAALEIALQELEDSLLPALPQDEDELLSLDGAMPFILGRRTQTT